MFNTEFTFNTSVGYGQNDSTQTVTDKQIERMMNKDKNNLFKKDISFKIHKQLIVKKSKIGFGDIVDFITKITGIKWFIIKITKGNCGCEKRKLLFNKWLTIPYFYVKIVDPVYEEFNIIDTAIEINKKYKNRVTNPNPINLPKKGCGCGRKK